MSKEMFLDFYYKTKKVPVINLNFDSLIGVLPKVYVNNYEVIDLPKPNDRLFKIRDINQVMLKRKSVRIFLRKPIDMETLSTLLYYSVGIRTYVYAYGFQKFPLRMFPSAGGLSEVETYVVPFNVNGLRKYNVYHYNALFHTLENINTNKEEGKVLYRHALSSLPNYIKETYPALIVILTISYGKVIEKYGARGARFTLIDAGIVTENFYLIGTALGLGVVALGGLSDEVVEKTLNINPREDLEMPALGILIGFPRVNEHLDQT